MEDFPSDSIHQEVTLMKKLIDNATLYCGDSAAILATLPADSIDLTVTSPPYDNLRVYKGHTWDFEATAKQLWRVTKPGGVLVWVVADETAHGSESGTSFKQALFFKEECDFCLVVRQSSIDR
jgi:site-specific DNA-methyltransferase (adenine-specific)